MNYKYCMRLMDKIQDEGDILMTSHEFEKCKWYYENQLKVIETVQYSNLRLVGKFSSKIDKQKCYSKLA